MTTFECARCGRCCRWHGYVRVSEEEIDMIAALLKQSAKDFIEQYTVLTRDRSGLSLAEREDGSCVFLENSLCRIEQAKPLQCRDFPLRWNFPGWREECLGSLKEDK